MAFRRGSLLAALLLIAAAIAWWRWPADLPPTPRRDLAPTAVDAATPAVVTPQSAPSAVAKANDAEVTLHRARAAFVPRGTAAAAWRGTTITAFAAGRQLRKREGRVLEFELPGGVHSVRFAARGYGDVVREVPALATDSVDELDFGEVVLEPDATLVIHIAPPLPDGVTGMRCRIEGAQGAITTVAGDGAELALAVPSGEMLCARVTLQGEAAIELAPRSCFVANGERHVLEFVVADVVTLQLTGIAHDLLPRLQVAITPAANSADQPPLLVRPDAEGRVRCALPAPRCRASVATTTRAVDLVAAEGRFDLVHAPAPQALAPAEPLLAIVAVARGAAVPSELLGFPAQAAQVWHVLPQADAPRATLRLRTAEHGLCEFAITELRRSGDVWTADLDRAERFGALVVQVRPAPQPAALLDLVAEPFAGGEAIVLTRDGYTCRADLRGGDYRLRWQIRGGAGPIAAEFVTVRAGETVQRALDALPLTRWTAACQTNGAGTAEPHVFLELDGVRSLGAAQGGVFTIDLATPPTVGTRGAIVLPALGARFPAQVTAVDLGSQRVTLDSAFATAHWVTVSPTARFGGELRIALFDAASGTWGTELTPPLRVPLAAGERRRGCVVEAHPHRDVVCWFELDGTNPPALQPEGHAATLRFAHATASHRVSLTGPTAMPPLPLRSAFAEQDHVLWIPAGTAAVVVESANGWQRTFAPEAAEIVVP